MVSILDHRGYPMPRQPTDDLAEPQTARIAQLYREFSDHPSRGLTPAKLASILQDGEEGRLETQARLAEDMEEKDAHLFAELSKRRRALLGLNWYLRPPKDATAQEKRATEDLESAIRDMDWEDVVYDSSAAILYGYSCLEYDWERSEGQWLLKAAQYRQPDWFMCPAHDRNLLALRTEDGQGELLRPWGWLVHTHKAKSGYLSRGGLARILAWPYLFRNYSARDLAEFLEIYGLPLRLGKYPAGATDNEKSTLMRAVVNIGHAAAGIIPQGMELEFQEAAKGASDPFMAMMHWAESSMSKAILGGTLTSQTGQNGGGAYALGEVHNEVRHDIMISDARQIARTLTEHLITPLARLNTGLTRMPTWVFETDQPEDLKLFADALPKLAAGIPISARWAREKLGIPAPESDDDVLDFTPRAAQPTPGPTTARAALRTQTEKEFPDQVALDEALELIASGEYQQDLTPVLAPVLKLAEQGSEALMQGLADLYPEMSTEALENRLRKALFAAELWGSIHAQQ